MEKVATKMPCGATTVGPVVFGGCGTALTRNEATDTINFAHAAALTQKSIGFTGTARKKETPSFAIQSGSRNVLYDQGAFIVQREAARAILVVDDCEDDVFMLLRSVKAVNLPHIVHCVDTVERAVCYLKGEGEFSDRERFPMAFLVLLDMKLAGQSGLDVLRWVRSNPNMWNVIVVAMTTVEDPALMEKAYLLGANSFLVKPFGMESTNEMVKALHYYWTKINRA
jgi:CheY-like chemotaxis protein